jgi:hypothetical protein
MEGGRRGERGRWGPPFYDYTAVTIALVSEEPINRVKARCCFYLLFLFYIILFVGIMIILSISLEIERKKESKIKMECVYSTNVKYYIKVYKFTMKRERI